MFNLNLNHMKNVKIFKRKFSIKKLLLALLMLVTITSCNSNERKAKKLIKDYCLEKDNIEVYDIKINKMEPVYINDYTEDPGYKKLEEKYNDIIKQLDYCEERISISTDYLNEKRSYKYLTLDPEEEKELENETEEWYDRHDEYAATRDIYILQAKKIASDFEPYLLGYNMIGRCKAKMFTGEGYVRLYVLFNPDITEIISIDASDYEKLK